VHVLVMLAVTVLTSCDKHCCCHIAVHCFIISEFIDKANDLICKSDCCAVFSELARKANGINAILLFIEHTYEAVAR